MLAVDELLFVTCSAGSLFTVAVFAMGPLEELTVTVSVITVLPPGARLAPVHVTVGEAKVQVKLFVATAET